MTFPPKGIKAKFFKPDKKKRLFYKATRLLTDEDILSNMGLKIT